MNNPGQARYLATLQGQDALGEPLRRQAAQVDLDAAQRWVCLSDGGAGLEHLLATQFGRADVVILDFYHASSYLDALALALFPADAAAKGAWLADWCHRLKHAGGATVLADLKGLAARGRAAKAAHRAVVQYFGNQVHRMDYPAYLAKGWQIGAGPVESACKGVGGRLKGPGMRWGEDGADSLCHLRALCHSSDDQWDAFFHPPCN